jgi:PAS domain S-box-containing protein
MSIFKKASTAIDQFTANPTDSPDGTRRKNLLNTLLVYTSLAVIIVLIISLVTLLLGIYKYQDIALLLYVCLAFFVLAFGILWLNRRSGRLAPWIYLIVFTFALALSDSPQNIGNGSSMFVFAIPIATASLLLSPASSFVFALLSAGIVTVLGITYNFIPNIPTILSFFILALISWLSARGLENALKDLRAINFNLDRLVQERTKELANALSRERIESGRTKAILESIADGVIVFDLHGKAIVANPSSALLLEMANDDLINKTIQDLSQSKSLDSFNRGILNNLLANPSSKSSNYHIQWGRKAISVTSAPVVDSDGQPIGTVAVFRDYTHEAEVEKMKNTFLAIVSHELRTPLNAILGYAEMLKEAVYGPVNEKQTRAADRIMTNSHRLLDIVSDLLDKAQMEAGKLSLHLQSFRPADLIDNVHIVMDKIAADKGLALTSELDPDLPEFIIGDISRLQQILVNLINNSIKFTEKGSVHMCLSRRDKKHWLLGISDTGIGIPEDELPNIFEAFRQVDSTATRKYGGFGLGLSIVKQLSELMDGDVMVNSELGSGSNFIVTLPLIQAKRSGK